jgi:hypothetical protein
MSYYIVKQPGKVYEAAAGLGAIVRQRRVSDRGRASRAAHRWNQPIRSPFRGMGAFDFNAATVWSQMQACNSAWQANQTTVPQCGQWTNAVRGALGTLGYGQLTMGQPWGAADIAAYKAWCGANGIAEGTYPTQSSLGVMEQQLSIGKVTGGETPTEYTEVDGELVPTAALTPAQKAQVEAQKKPFNYAALAIGAAALIGVAAIAIAAKRHGSSRATVVTGALPTTAAAKA